MLTGSGLVQPPCGASEPLDSGVQNVGEIMTRNPSGTTAIGDEQFGISIELDVCVVRSTSDTGVSGLPVAHDVAPTTTAFLSFGRISRSTGRWPTLAVARMLPSFASMKKTRS